MSDEVQYNSKGYILTLVFAISMGFFFSGWSTSQINGIQ